MPTVTNMGNLERSRNPEKGNPESKSRPPREVGRLFTASKEQYESIITKAAKATKTNLNIVMSEPVKTVLPNKPNENTIEVVQFRVKGNPEEFWKKVGEIKQNKRNPNAPKTGK